MDPTSIAVWFVCRLCRGSFGQVDAFIEHKKQKHFTQFQNTTSIVFEETEHGLLYPVNNIDHELVNEGNEPRIKMEVSDEDPIIPFSSEIFDEPNVGHVEPKSELITYESEINSDSENSSKKAEQNPYVRVKRLNSEEIQRACDPQHPSTLLLIGDDLSFNREELLIQGIDCEEKLVRKRQLDVLDSLETPSGSWKKAKNLPADVWTTSSEIGEPEVTEEHFRLLNEKNETIRSLEIKLGKFERENRVYKRMLKSRDDATMDCETDEMESLGDGVSVSKNFMDYLRIGFKSRPSHFFRQLVFESGLFDLQEVADCSINGKWQNRSKSGRPGLDSVKMQAVKAATILHCELKEKTWAMADFERKILTICSDARKKLQRLALKNSSIDTQDDERVVSN